MVIMITSNIKRPHHTRPKQYRRQITNDLPKSIVTLEKKNMNKTVGLLVLGALSFIGWQVSFLQILFRLQYIYYDTHLIEKQCKLKYLVEGNVTTCEFRSHTCIQAKVSYLFDEVMWRRAKLYRSLSDADETKGECAANECDVPWNVTKFVSSAGPEGLLTCLYDPKDMDRVCLERTSKWWELPAILLLLIAVCALIGKAILRRFWVIVCDVDLLLYARRKQNPNIYKRFETS